MPLIEVAERGVNRKLDWSMASTWRGSVSRGRSMELIFLIMGSSWLIRNDRPRDILPSAPEHPLLFSQFKLLGLCPLISIDSLSLRKNYLLEACLLAVFLMSLVVLLIFRRPWDVRMRVLWWVLLVVFFVTFTIFVNKRIVSGKSNILLLLGGSSLLYIINQSKVLI